MFSKRRFRRNKPRSQNFLESGEQQKETPFIPPVQTKLNIGKPGDVYEVEADKTADEVVNKTTSPDTVQKMGAKEEEVQAKPLSKGLTPFVQKQEVKEEEQVQTKNEEEEPVQTMQEDEEPVQTKEDEEAMQAKEEEEPVQTMEEQEEDVQSKEEEEESVQTKSKRSNKVGDDFEQELGRQGSKGQKLASKDRRPLETAFGADFSNVRIHTDGKANELNEQLNAKAFAHGADIYFKNGNFNPSSREGKHLLAHELTHTIQQGAIDTTKPAGSHKKASSIQRVPIDYRAVTWADFNGPTDTTSKFDAATASGIELVMKKGYINGKVAWNGKIATASVFFNSKLLSLKAFMETDTSWKRNWLTDDKAAKDKFGKGVNIKAKRKSLLSHEQIHFKITNSIAKSYVQALRAVVPKKPYVEKGPATSEAERDAFLDTVMNKKGDELQSAIDAVYNKANTELDAVQELYDDGTKHSQNAKAQKNWKTKYSKTLKAARKKAKADAAASK